jgi:hypothetical protein
MKLVKMRNKDLDNFDAFFQNKLQNFDVDENRADQYMGEMNFPVPLEERSFWKVFYLYFSYNKKISATIAVLLFSGIAGILLLKNDIKPTEKKKEEMEKGVVKSSTSISTKKDINTNLITEIKTTTKLEQTTLNKLSRSSKPKQISVEEDVIKKPVEKTFMASENKLETSDAFKNQMILKDSISGKVKTKDLAAKQDTINIIW